ncbi:MAG TPA: D-alanine--D-alanine ligase [Candidatus Omnitrophota bacterium]|nr:D-alanine--D-alanine ligase [Candidatus Omnitrophota bacterium]
MNLTSYTIGVLLGGFSSERSVSIKSGTAVLESLKRSGLTAIAIDPRSKNFETKLNRVDAVFIALHGEFGEDGQIQKLLEKKKIPYAGSQVKGMQISFDKLKTKQILKQKGLPTPPFWILTRANWKYVAARIPGSFFIKPFTEGSSVGVELIESFEKNADIIRKSVHRYGKILAEAKVTGREVTAGILGDKKLPVVEIRTQRAFYDYTAKYTPGFTEYVTEHGLPGRQVRRIQNTAMKVFKALQMRDFGRIDMMLDEKGRPYVLEANSIPGLTAMSLLPKAAGKAGISFDELVLTIVGMAARRIKKVKGKH